MSIGTRSAIVYPIVLLSILALLTAWINHVVQPPKPKLDGSSRHDPDYIMSNFVTTQTDINGGLRYILAAAEMKHFPDNDTTDLQRPRYTQFAANKPYTQVESLHGYVSSDGNQVQLVNNVKITRQAFAGKGEMTVDTDYLNILPNEDIVRTESPVIIRQAPKTIIHATGMVYEKKINTVTLLHKVRAHYEKPQINSANTSYTETLSIKPPNIQQPATIKPNSGTTTIQQPNAIKSNTTEHNSTDARIRRRYE